MKALYFILMIAGQPVEHFDDAYLCNQAALELANTYDRVGCHGYDADHNEITVRGDREITYIRPTGPGAPLRLELKVIE